MYHPDKLKGEEPSAVNKEMWLKIQNAYEKLSNPEERKKYDSTLPFDDSIPSDDEEFSEEVFYATFRPVFERNAQWSKQTPVPGLGDENTVFKKVNTFYDFWFDFRTWRDFSQHDEYDLNEAADRYEKRYMDRENKKVREKHLRKERARINKLVETAYKHDPRVLREARKAEEEKARKRNEKLARKQRERDELREREE